MQDSAEATASAERDINDVFSDIFLTENRIFQRGFQEGFEEGQQTENVEAYHLGYHRGAEIGAEIGYFTGVVESYITHLEEKNAPRDQKLLQELTSFKKTLGEFPKENDPNVDTLALLNQVRAKFKKICAKLKIHPEFPESDQLSF